MRRTVSRSLSQMRKKFTRFGFVIFEKMANCDIVVILGFLFTKKIIKNTMNGDTIAGYLAAALIIFGVQLVRLGKRRAVSKDDWAKIKDDAKRRTVRQGGGAPVYVKGGKGMNI
jgi:hypothetical protein